MPSAKHSRARHAKNKAPCADIAKAQGDLFLGIDLGSTTIKGVVLDSDSRIVHSWYEQNEGNPLEKTLRADA